MPRDRTGANMEPLGKRRHFAGRGGDDDDSETKPDVKQEYSDFANQPPPLDPIEAARRKAQQIERKMYESRNRDEKNDEKKEDSRGRVKGEYNDDEEESSRRRRSRSKDRDERRKRSRSRKRSKSKERKRSRSRSKDRDRDGEKKKKKKRERSRSRDKKRRSRSRSKDRKKKSRRDSSRSRSRSRSRGRSGSHEKPDYANMAMVKYDSAIPQDLKLPPALRGAVVAQSLLAKPEAVSKVVERAAEEVGKMGAVVPYDLSTPRDKRVKKSRWSTTKAFVPGMPTILPSDMDDTQRQAYLLQMEIEECTRKLRLGDFIGMIDDGDERSPSPEPIYDANGKRLNTRDVRKRQETEQKRHELICKMLNINPSYKPPADYRTPNIKLAEKVWIPQEDHPEINFVGLLIGPRGNTLKALEAETGAKIIIRGKGSIKEGKLALLNGPLPGANEPLHAYITGTDPALVRKGVERIQSIINEALMIPDGQNKLRQLQLRELALLNGTMRPEDLLSGAHCSNCGSEHHKTWECQEGINITAATVCPLCGNSGHIARDCKAPNTWTGGMDDEYSALMMELGEKPPEPMPYTGGLSAVLAAGKTAAKPGGNPPAPNYRMPSGAPVQKIALGSQSKTGPQWPPGPDGIAASEPPAFFPPPLLGPNGQWMPPPPGMFPPGWPPGFPTPVPPPPPPSGGLAMFPPPPPPPPPKKEGESSGAADGDQGQFQAYPDYGYGGYDQGQADLTSFLAPPAPPPPPPS